MQYKLVISGSGGSESLSSLVQEFLDDGWKLYGNPFLGRNGCCQAAIKEDAYMPKETKGFGTVKVSTAV